MSTNSNFNKTLPLEAMLISTKQHEHEVFLGSSLESTLLIGDDKDGSSDKK
jgi:hypothetical protein